MEKLKRALRRAKGLWNRYGYYVSIALIVCLVGASAYMIRARSPNLPDDRPMASPAPELTAEVSEDDAPAAAIAASKYCLPASGAAVLNTYSDTEPVWSKTLFEWHVHKGIDLAASAGEVVVAVADGYVLAVTKDSLLGYTIELLHEDGLVTRYASLLTSGLVKEGERVSQGQEIGAVGSSAASESAEAPHLHFEAYQDGEWAAILEPLLATMDDEN